MLTGLVSYLEDGCLLWAFSVCFQGEISGISYYEDTVSVGLEPRASDLNYFQRPCLQSNQPGV